MSPTVRAQAAYVALFAAVGASAPYLPVYYRSLGFGLDAVGFLTALAAAMGLMAAPVWGSIADRSAVPRLVMPAAAGLAASAALALSAVGL
jgi:nitrate/nitrite transporter NarK